MEPAYYVSGRHTWDAITEIGQGAISLELDIIKGGGGGGGQLGAYLGCHYRD